MKSNWPEITNAVASKTAKGSTKRKLLRAKDQDKRMVHKGRNIRRHKWYHGNAECGVTSKASPWANRNNLPGYPSLNPLHKSGETSLDAWFEDKGIGREDPNALEGVDVSDHAHYMGGQVTRLWYK